MYCSKCGMKNDGNNYCVRCGNRLNNLDNSDNNNFVERESSGLKTASIILGIMGIIGSLLIIFSPISFVFSLVGLVLGIFATKKVRNVSGLVLNSVGLFLSIVILGMIVFFYFFVFKNNNDQRYKYNNDYFHNKYYEKFENNMEEY